MGLGFGDRGSLEDGQCDLGFSDGLKGRADGGGSRRVCGWLDGEEDVGEKLLRRSAQQRDGW